MDRVDSFAAQSLLPEEQNYYTTLWKLAGCNDNSPLAGRGAFEFLLKSGLDKLTLRNIWSTADVRQCHALKWAEFVFAMRLIALAQENQCQILDDVALKRSTATSPLLPTFQGASKPQVEEKFEKCFGYLSRCEGKFGM